VVFAENEPVEQEDHRQEERKIKRVEQHTRKANGKCKIENVKGDV
jgi:hypothetical protein